MLILSQIIERLTRRLFHYNIWLVSCRKWPNSDGFNYCCINQKNGKTIDANLMPCMFQLKMENCEFLKNRIDTVSLEVKTNLYTFRIT